MSIYHKLALDPNRFVQILLSSTCTISGNIYLHVSLSMIRCQVSCPKLRQIMYMKFDTVRVNLTYDNFCFSKMILGWHIIIHVQYIHSLIRLYSNSFHLLWHHSKEGWLVNYWAKLSYSNILKLFHYRSSQLTSHQSENNLKFVRELRVL